MRTFLAEALKASCATSFWCKMWWLCKVIGLRKKIAPQSSPNSRVESQSSQGPTSNSKSVLSLNLSVQIQHNRSTTSDCFCNHRTIWLAILVLSRLGRRGSVRSSSVAEAQDKFWVERHALEGCCRIIYGNQIKSICSKVLYSQYQYECQSRKNMACSVAAAIARRVQWSR